ncbi:MAG: AMP-binding protein, partial [Rhodospirillales bacterium]|nr:AMP-binding protein [Rhodospirillales bacterium]
MDLGTAFECALARDPGATAIIDGGVRRSYGEWDREIRALAGGLTGLGLQQGDHVVAVMSNRVEMATLYWACQTAGLIFTPFNWRAASGDIAYVLADADTKAVVFEDAVADTVQSAIASCGVD